MSFLKKKVGKRVEEMTDEEIVRSLQGNMDAQRFGVLYDKYVEKVYHKCISMSRDRDLARDLSHDIFVKVFLNISKFNFKSSFSTWLYRITYNYCLDHLRKAQRIRNQDIDDIQIEDGGNDDLYEKELLELRAERLQTVLDNILPDDRALLLMKYQESMSVKDIMDVMELNESAVKMRVLRARSRALEKYQELFPQEP